MLLTNKMLIGIKKRTFKQNIQLSAISFTETYIQKDIVIKKNI